MQVSTPIDEMKITSSQHVRLQFIVRRDIFLRFATSNRFHLFCPLRCATKLEMSW
jgi:hypothetical protein